MEGTLAAHAVVGGERVAEALAARRGAAVGQVALGAVGVARAAQAASKARRRRADLLYGDVSPSAASAASAASATSAPAAVPRRALGGASLAWGSRSGHKLTELAELDGWAASELQAAAAAAAAATSGESPPFPVLVLTRGRRGVLFGASLAEGDATGDGPAAPERGVGASGGRMSVAEAMEAAWDDGLRRLLDAYAPSRDSGQGNGRTTVLASIEKGGARLPLYQPAAVAIAVAAAAAHVRATAQRSKCGDASAASAAASASAAEKGSSGAAASWWAWLRGRVGTSSRGKTPRGELHKAAGGAGLGLGNRLLADSTAAQREGPEAVRFAVLDARP